MEQVLHGKTPDLRSSLVMGWLTYRRASLPHYPEQVVWLANMVAWLWLNPYIQLYTLWIALLPIRWVSGKATGVLWVVTFAIVWLYLREYKPEIWINGVMGLMLVWIGVGLYTIKPMEEECYPSVK